MNDTIEVRGPLPRATCEPAMPRLRRHTRSIEHADGQVHAQRARRRRCRRATRSWPTSRRSAASSTRARRSSASTAPRWTSRTTRPAARSRPTGVAWPNNGVLYVDNGTTACKGEFPTEANYDEAAACGNVYVSGTYSKSLTIAAARRHHRHARRSTRRSPTARPTPTSRPVDGSDATLGLIADDFVRVAPPRADGDGDLRRQRADRRADRQRTSRSRPRSCRSSTRSSSTTTTAARLGTLTDHRRDHAEVPRHRVAPFSDGTIVDRLHEELLVRRPLPLPLPAVLPGPGRLRLGRRAHARAGPGALARDRTLHRPARRKRAGRV